MIRRRKQGARIVEEDESGQITLQLPGGSKYVGEAEEGVAEGYGRLIFPDGRELTGTFSGGRPHGEELELTFPDGRKFTGGYANGKRHGYGKMTFPDGTEYEGEWENDLPHGQGRMVHPDGSIETGTWVKGKIVKPGEERVSGTNRNRNVILMVVVLAAVALILIAW